MTLRCVTAAVILCIFTSNMTYKCCFEIRLTRPIPNASVTRVFMLVLLEYSCISEPCLICQNCIISQQWTLSRFPRISKWTFIKYCSCVLISSLLFCLSNFRWYSRVSSSVVVAVVPTSIRSSRSSMHAGGSAIYVFELTIVSKKMLKTDNWTHCAYIQ